MLTYRRPKDTLGQTRINLVSLIPFGCDYELFATAKSVGPAAVSSLDKPVVVLMGTINDRLDLGILTAIAARDVSLLMLGPKARGWESEEFDRMVAKANVTLVWTC